MSIKDIISKLDAVAGSMESSGFIKEAARIDVIANTIESMTAPYPQETITAWSDTDLTAISQAARANYMVVQPSKNFHQNGEFFLMDQTTNVKLPLKVLGMGQAVSYRETGVVDGRVFRSATEAVKAVQDRSTVAHRDRTNRILSMTPQKPLGQQPQ